jgi:hypothetical protein
VFAEGTPDGTKGKSITLSTMDIWGKNDHNIPGPSYSKAAVSPADKTIKARAYASLGLPAAAPANQTASGYLGSRFYLTPGNVVHAWVRVTYNGVIGSLGVSAGKVKPKGRINAPPDLVYDRINEKVIPDTASGGIPSGAISNTFTTSFNTCLKTKRTYDPVVDLFIAAGQSSTGNVAGVCDNDFYEGNRQVKVNRIKIEVLDSCAVAMGGQSGVPGGSGPGGRTIIPK